MQTAAINAAESAPSSDKRNLISLVPYTACLIFAAMFAAFALFSKNTRLVDLVIGGIAIVFFDIILIRCISRFLTGRDGAEMNVYGERSIRKLHAPARTAVFSVLAQLTIIVSVYAVGIIRNGMTHTLPDTYRLMFYESNSVIFGANTVDIMSKIGLISFILPDSAALLASSTYTFILFAFINTAAIVAGAIFLQELMLIDYDQKIARISVAAYHLLPSIFLMLQPLSGIALFFASALLCLLLARKGRLFASGIAGLVSGIFNIFGVLLAASVFLEARAHSPVFANIAVERGEHKPRKHYLAALIPLVGALIAIVLKLLKIDGLSALSTKPIWFFEPVGSLIAHWGSPNITKPEIVVHILSVIIVWLTFLVCSNRTRSSVNAFTLLMLCLAHSFLAADLTSFAVLSCPFLAVYVASRSKWRAMRIIVAILLIAVLLLFIAFLYIVKVK